jgi:hypothetical protein
MTWQQAKHPHAAWTPLQQQLQATARLAHTLQSGEQRCVLMQSGDSLLSEQWSLMHSSWLSTQQSAKQQVGGKGKYKQGGSLDLPASLAWFFDHCDWDVQH